VNKPLSVNKGIALEADALRVLRSIPGITVAFHEPHGANRRADAVLRFGDTETEVVVEVKTRANAATAWQLVHYVSELPDTRLLLIADETTAEARSILSEHGIAVIDSLGNAHIELPGLLLHLQGDRRKARNTPPSSLSYKTGTVAQALLLAPERAWQVKDLAERARVSGSLAHRVLARLDREGITSTEGVGPRRVRHVTDPTALLDLWAEEDRPQATRISGHLLARSPRQLIEKLGKHLTDDSIQYAISGAGAASMLAPFVSAVPVVDVWVTANATPDDLFSAAGAEPVENGQNIVFLQTKNNSPLAFRENVRGTWLANRFRVYADLLADPRRGAEQARHLRDEAIGF
jgi:Transcriptional regulator, AbiEi antitoxin, Type IV TA system